MTEHAPEPVKVEDCKKRVRIVLGGQIVADTVCSKLVWEVPYYPVYYIPARDVRGELVASGDGAEPSARLGEARYFTVKAGDRVVFKGAWHYPESPVQAIRQHVRFQWEAMDGWFEEDEEVFVHPHDPHKRIDILHGSRHVQVAVGGVVLADTRKPTLLYETGAPARYYVPKVDVRMDLLVPTETRTGCAYKGFARYWSVAIGGETHADLAWSYPMPLPEAAKIAGLVCFYNERVDLRVDGVSDPRR